MNNFQKHLCTSCKVEGAVGPCACGGCPFDCSRCGGGRICSQMRSDFMWLKYAPESARPIILSRNDQIMRWFYNSSLHAQAVFKTDLSGSHMYLRTLICEMLYPSPAFRDSRLFNRNFVAQGGNVSTRKDEVRDAVNKYSILDGVRAALGLPLKLAGGIAGSVAGFAKALVSSVFGVFGVARDGASGIFGSLADKMVGLICRILDPVNALMDLAKNSWIAYALKAVLAYWVFYGLCYALGFSLDFLDIIYTAVLAMVKTVYKTDTGLEPPDIEEPVAQGSGSGFVGQAPASLITLLFSAVSVFLVGTERSDKSWILDNCRDLVKVFAAGTVLTSMAQGFFFLFPQVLQDVFRRLFGGQTSRDKLYIEKWQDQALMLIKTAKVPNVLTSKIFFEKLTDVMREGWKGMHSITNPALRSILVVSYGKLLSIKASLVQYREGCGTRPLPYSLHFAGPPGVGKTLLTPRFIFDIMGFCPADIYTVPLSGDFWSGFISQPVVMYDEFLLGSPEKVCSTACEYLGLVSTDMFQPNMPSLDSPTTGLKGTVAAPKVVVSINNTNYNHVSGISEDALHRRRRYVVQMVFADDAKFRVLFDGKVSLNEVDISAYDEDVRKDFPWVKFRLLPPCFNKLVGLEPGPWMTYSAMVEGLKVDYAKFQETQLVVTEALGLGLDESRDPGDIMNEVLQEMGGLNVRDCSFVGVVKSMFGFVSQGSSDSDSSWSSASNSKPRKRNRHSHTCTNCSTVWHHTECVNTWCENCMVPFFSKSSLTHAKNPFRGLPPPIYRRSDEKKVWYSCQAATPECTTSFWVLRGKKLSQGCFPCFSYLEAQMKSASSSNSTHSPVSADALVERLKTLSSDSTPSCVRRKDLRAGSVLIEKPVDFDCEHEDYGFESLTSPELVFYTMKAGDVTSPARETLYWSCISCGIPALVPFPNNKCCNCLLLGGITGRPLRGPYGVRRRKLLKEPIVVSPAKVVSKESIVTPSAKVVSSPEVFLTPPEESFGFGDPTSVMPLSGRKIGVLPPPRSDLVYNNHHIGRTKSFLGTDASVVDWDTVTAANYTAACDLTLARFSHHIERFFRCGGDLFCCQEDAGIRDCVRRSKSCLFWGALTVTALWFLSRFVLNTSTVSEEAPTFDSQSMSSPDVPGRPTGPLDRGAKVCPKLMKRGCALVAQGSKPLLMNILWNGITIHGFGIRDRTIATYKHAFYSTKFSPPEAGAKMVLVVRGKSYPFEYNPDLTVSDSDGDLLLINLDNKQIPPFADIAHRFLTCEELSNLLNTRVLFSSTDRSCYGVANRVTDLQYGVSGGVQLIAAGLQYNIETKTGDCGALVTICEGIYAGRPVGMHLAGNGQFGACAFISSEDLGEPDPVVIGLTREPFLAQGGRLYDHLSESIADMPNLVSFSQIDRDQTVFIPNTSCIRPSLLSNDLPFVTDREPAILSSRDPRAGGVDPVIAAIDRVLGMEQCPVDQPIVDDIVASVIRGLDSLPMPLGKRKLTFLEACTGVPGIYNAMNMKSSCGYPYIQIFGAAGKRECCWFDEAGDFQFTQSFHDMVVDLDDRVMIRDFPDHVWLVYLKDETVPSRKIDAVKTRMVYSGDVVSLVLFRQYFGYLCAGFVNSLDHVASIGVNVCSWDLNYLHERLSRVGSRYVAGDYKGFDMHMQTQFRDGIYRGLLQRAIKDGVPPLVCDYLFQHELYSEVQVLDVRLRLKSGHPSGCFLTSIVNSLVNEAYMRYAFLRLNPGHIFSEHVVMYAHGDDHLLCVSHHVDMLPSSLARVLAEVGQEYTTTDKDLCFHGYDTFSQITYLAAHPKKVHGMWCGALRKETLENCLLWTKNRGVSLAETAHQVLDAASVWDRDYFDRFSFIVHRACELNSVKIRAPCAWEEVRYVQATRTAGPVVSLPFDAQGKEPKKGKSAKKSDGENTKSSIDAKTVHGLTTLSTGKMIKAETIKTDSRCLATRSIGEKALDINFGTEGLVYRKEYTWTSSQVVTTELSKLTVPFGVLSQGDNANLQNMPFDRFIYWHGETELVLQVNGTPFQQGLCVAYFYPLSDARPGIKDYTACQHVFLSPTDNTTASLLIPFRFPRNVLNTFNKDEVLGYFHIDVLSRLRSVKATEVTITLYSRFPKSTFSIPRPLAKTFDDELESIGELRAENLALRKVIGRKNMVSGVSSSVVEGSAQFVAQGNISSINKTYNISDVAGDLPIQDRTNVGLSTDVDAEAVLPMDNPPLASGSIPTHMNYSSLSKAVGVEPTTSLQLHPKAVDLSHRCVFDGSEMSINYLCGKKCLWKTVDWTTEQATSTELGTWDLNSLFSDVNDTGAHDGANAKCANLFFLNQFVFWRADVELTFLAVRTKFHSGRLRFVIGYGAPIIQVAKASTYYNHILEFKEDSSEAKVLIPYNAATEFLRTFEGLSQDRLQNHSIASLGLFVVNKLRAPDTVSDTIEVLIFGRLLNVKVAVPRPLPFMRLRDTNYSEVTPIMPVPAVPFFVAQGVDDPEDDVPTNEEAVDPAVAVIEAPTAVSTEKKKPGAKVTANEIPKRPTVPCKLELNKKFEFCVSSIGEVLRRGVARKFEHDGNQNIDSSSSNVTAKYTIIPVVPISPFYHFFAGWAGSIRYRILQKSTDNTEVSYFPLMCHSDAGTSDYLVGHTMLPRGTMKFTDPNGVQCYLDTEGNYGVVVSREVGVVNGGIAYLDVTVPYQSHFSFSSIRWNTTDHPITGDCTGVLALGRNSASAPCRVYTSVGDDFAFGMFRPPISGFYHYTGVSIKPSVAVPPVTPVLPTAWKNVAGWYLKSPFS